VISPAFQRAERTRSRRKPATAPQRRRIAELARKAGVEPPRVYWSTDASKVIDVLGKMVRQPTLGRMG
jgi:hypothetical protein